MILKKYTKLNPRERRPRSKSSTGLEYSVYLLSCLLLLLGGIALGMQYLSPFLSVASRSAYLKPVGSSYLSTLISTRDQFSFRELRHQKIYSENPSSQFVPEFSITIPALDLNAKVETNSASLKPDLRLGHLSGSSLPGQDGMTVVYGHSSSPLLYKPDDYQTIFSHLDQLKKGDAVRVTYDGEEYTYVVRLLEVATPEDLDLGLASPTRGSLALITCYPFGTLNKRLIVYADLTY